MLDNPPVGSSADRPHDLTGDASAASAAEPVDLTKTNEEEEEAEEEEEGRAEEMRSAARLQNLRGVSGMLAVGFAEGGRRTVWTALKGGLDFRVREHRFNGEALGSGSAERSAVIAMGAVHFVGGFAGLGPQEVRDRIRKARQEIEDKANAGRVA